MSASYRQGIRVSLFTLVLLSASLLIQAQRTISGKIIASDSKLPLSGATISVKGKTTATVSDENGSYTISIGETDLLVITMVGYSRKELRAADAMLILLDPDAQNLNEVVVTALGIRREKKKLGYAIQEVKGEDLTVARETNVVNQLAGKVAGVTVIGSPSGIGGSARVSIRGERSVDLKKNQPLYVIDGVPVSNAITGASGRGNMEVDFGNGAGFINPDDIESMSVLKGPAAAALYGSRAANGVILIKTKGGKKNRGLGVEVASNFTLESALKLPDYQKVYGQGIGDDFAFVNGAGGGVRDGTDEGWGPAFKGQSFPQYNSPRTLNGQVIPFTGADLNAPAGSVITALAAREP